MKASFETKAEKKTLNILRDCEYCLVTPLTFLNESGDCTEGEPVKCTSTEEVRDLYNCNDDVMIHTPYGCNF